MSNQPPVTPPNDPDDIFSLPPSGSPSSTNQPYVVPPYSGPTNTPSQQRGPSRMLYIIIGMIVAVFCICGGCIALAGGSFMAVFNNPTVQAALVTAQSAIGTGSAFLQAPDRLPSGADKQGALLPDQSKTGNMSAFTPQTWTYNGQSGEKITITVRGSQNSFDPIVGVYDISGKLLARNDLSSSNQGQSFTATLPSDGTYTILVSSLGGAPGSYTIALKSNSSQ